jgi:hypothetical protein
VVDSLSRVFNFVKEVVHASFDLVADATDLSSRLPVRVVEIPIAVFSSPSCGTDVVG